MASVFKGIVFGARQIIKPGVYAKVNADAMVPNRVGPANTIGVIGTCTGGKPKTITTINSPIEAREQLRSGKLLSVTELMYDPSPDLPGAGEVKYYRLNAAVQGSLILKDSVPGNVITVTAKDSGVWTNQLRVKIEAGSLFGSKISISDVMDPLAIEEGDNLGNAFLIQYVGGQLTSTISIAKTGDAAISLTLKVATLPDVVVDLTNENIGTMGALVDFLNGIQDFTVSLVGDQNLPVSELDALSLVDIKTAAVNTTANIGSIVFFLNTRSIFVSATRATGAVNTPATIPFTFLSGGSEGPAITNQDWSDALDAFKTEDVSFIFVASENNAIHAMALAHCVFTSDIKQRRERITIVGGAANETVEQAVTRAQGLGDSRAPIIYPGIKRINVLTGNIDNLSPMYSAAVATGMASGVTVETPLTFKLIRASGLEKDLTLTEIERLLDRGVMPLEANKSDGTFRIVQGITSYLKDANVIFRKIAGIRIHDFLNREVRNATQKFVGRVADKRTVTSILNAAATKLRALTRDETNLNGVLTAGVAPDGSVEPSFKNLTAVFDGFDLVALSYEAHPVGEVAYITITAALTPTKIVARA